MPTAGGCRNHGQRPRRPRHPAGERPRIPESHAIVRTHMPRPVGSDPQQTLGASALLPAGHGELPSWDISDLPAPPPFGLRNVLKVIGPGAIMAATSIGGGEWLVGPAAAVKYGSAIFLIATVAIVL